jgi:hypothetical protein
MNRPYGDAATPRLRLITCGGRFEPAARNYRDNIVVYADMQTWRAQESLRRAHRPGSPLRLDDDVAPPVSLIAASPHRVPPDVSDYSTG